MADLGRAYVQIIPAAEGISGKIEEALSPESKKAGEDAGKTIGQQIGSFAKKAVIGLGVGKAISDSVSNGMEFETAMAKASTLFSGTDAELDKLQGDILDISSKTGVAAAQLAEAAYSAESASVPMGNLGTMIENSAKLATAGYTDIDTALSATAKTMNAYGMVSDDVASTNEAMEKVQRILIQTQNKGITTVGELGASLANVTPTAAAAGVGFEQVGAALAVMTAQGTPTAQATTQLRSAIAELEKEGTKASSALSSAAKGTEYAGMSFVEMMDSGADLGDVMGMLQDYADASGVSMLDLWSSVEGGNAAMAIAKDVSNFDDSLAAMATDADVVGEAYGTMADTMENQMARIGTSLTNLGIEAFSAAAPTLTSALDGVLAVFQNIKPTISTLGGAFGKLFSAVGNVIGKLLGLDDGLSTTDSASKGLTIVLNGISDAVGFLADAVNAASGIIVPVFQGIGAVAQAIWDTVVGLFTGTIQIPSLGDIASAAWGGLKGIAGGIWDFIKGLFGSSEGFSFPDLGGIAADAWNFIKDAADAVWSGIQSLFSSEEGFSFPDLTTIATKAWNFISSAAETVWSGIQSLFGGSEGFSFPDLTDAATSAWNFISGAAETVWTDIQTLFGGSEGFSFPDLTELATAAWDYISTAAEEVWTSIQSLFDSEEGFTFPDLTVIAEKAWNLISTAAETMWSGVQTLFSSATGFELPDLTDIAATAWSFISSAAEDMWAGIQTLFKSAAGFELPNLTETATEAWNFISSAAETVWSGIQTLFSGSDGFSFPDLSGIATEAWNFISSAAETVWSGIQDLFAGSDGFSFADISSAASEAWDSITKTAGDIWDGIKDVFGAADISMEDITSAATTAWNGISGVASDLWEDIKGIFGQWPEDFKWPDFGALVKGAFDGIRDAAQSVWDWVTGLFSGGGGEEEAVKSVQGSTTEMASALADANLKINDVDMSSIILANEHVKNTVLSWINIFDHLKLKIPIIDVTALSSTLRSIKAYAENFKAAMKFTWTLPTLHGHLPVVSVNMRTASSSDGKTRVSYPDLSVSSYKWFAKGGIFNEPTIIGIGDSKGPEAAVPLDMMWNRLSAEFDKHMGGEPTVNNYFTVDGAQDPEAWAMGAARAIRRELRMA